MYVDAYSVISARYVVICDTLLCPTDMQIVMENVRPELTNGRQLLVVNSHADWDHAWGNSYFTSRQNAPLLAHHHCRERLQSAEAQAENLQHTSNATLLLVMSHSPLPTLPSHII